MRLRKSEVRAKRLDAIILRGRGLTYDQIATQLSSSKTSVVEWCRGCPAPPRKTTRPIKDPITGKFQGSRP